MGKPLNGKTGLNKQDSATRIYGKNVSGLSIDQRGGQLDELLKVLKEVQADVFCGREHNLESNNTQVRQLLYHTSRRHWTRSQVTFATTPIILPKQCKPGGTFMITAGDLTGRVIAQNTDKWGRWASQTFKGRETILVAVNYSAYQVVNKPITVGSITTAAQQHSLLLQAHDTLTNPRSAFRRNLTASVQASIAAGQKILLMGDDFNKFSDRMMTE